MESNPNQQTNQSVKTAEFTDKSKSNKPLIVTTVITSILALAGIGAGIYFFMDSNNKSTEISDLNTKIATLNSQISSNQSTAAPDPIDTKPTDTTTVINAKNYGFTTDNIIGDHPQGNMSLATSNGAKFILYANGTIAMSVDGEACKNYSNISMDGHYYGNTCIDGHFEKDITSLIPGRAVDASVKTFRLNADDNNWIFFVLEDGTVALIYEYDALGDQPATIMENSKNIIHLFGGGFAQDNSGKIHAILPHTDSNGEISFTVE